MMTPSELREYEFKSAGRNAYKTEDVDNFLGEVAVAYEKIFRENAELVKRVGLLADRLEQFKQDEDQIKQAVIGAQRAADIIIKEAETSVEDSKAEAEAIIAAAKGEADIIKADAEKQAIADSDLLLSIARDKAEDIISKAKEEAHSVLIEANNSAKDTIGNATRTITSESLHYEMLKKEVSEFRASILAQYKTHIELISKLPELAVAEIEKQNDETVSELVAEDIVDEINSVDPENDIIEFIEAEDTEELSEASIYATEEASEDVLEQVVETDSIDSESATIEFIEPTDTEEEFTLASFEDIEADSEEVVKTTLPYDFFGEENSLEFVGNSEAEDEEVSDIIDFNNAFEASEGDIEFVSDNSDENEFSDDEQQTKEVADENDPEDIPISKGFTVNTESVDNFSNNEDANYNPMFDSFEKIEDNSDDESEAPKKRFGFFKRK